jgi:hypothetical protein
MFPLRCDWKLLCSATSVLSLCAAILGGCATTASLTRIEIAARGAAGDRSIHFAQLSDADAEIVVAHAIAEHEMRQP